MNFEAFPLYHFEGTLQELQGDLRFLQSIQGRDDEWAQMMRYTQEVLGERRKARVLAFGSDKARRLRHETNSVIISVQLRCPHCGNRK